MLKLNDKEIQEFICNETSYFALNIIDTNTKEVIYANRAMKNIMADVDAKECWKSIYGESERCSWCKLEEVEAMKKETDGSTAIYEYEHFNEFANRWFKVQKKLTKLEDGRDILISILIDISSQKESQAQLITSQVKLTQQAQKLKEAHRKLELLAATDSMTGLYNRRYFLETSKNILELAKRNNEHISVLILDIDDFKNINDSYGHKVGDDSIIMVANILQEITRKSDIVCRFGGEEFTILLPYTGLKTTTNIAESIRKKIENSCVKTSNGVEVRFTVSIGVSEVDTYDEKNIELAIYRADEALYEAKDSGKNMVCQKPIN